MLDSNTSTHRAAPAGSLSEPGSGRAADSNGDATHTGQAPSRKGKHPTSGAVPAEWARVCDLAMKQLDRCVSLEPKVLQGDDPNAVHDLRVATRRLQQVLDLMFPSPRPREIRKLRRRLKRCRSALSEVRNCDVLLDRVDSALARKRTARREARSAIRDYLVARRSAKFEKALPRLTGVNLADLYVRMKDCLLGRDAAISDGEGADRHPNAGIPTDGQFHSRIGENLKAVWEALEDQIAQSQRQPEAAAFHRVRIAAKRMRYLAEVIHAFGVQGSPEVLIWLRSLQKHLGHWHDLVVFEETVIEMLADPDFLRDHLELAIDIERLILKNRKLRTKFEGRYLEAIADQADLLRAKGWVRRIIATPSAVFAHS
ncbi:MAG: CHAD domain-containing protein [Acidobacteria bacterium]|nr:CHAD domain-containing protein [Acidobacteriota bacterium]